MKRFTQHVLFLTTVLLARPLLAGSTWTVSASVSDGAAQSLRAAVLAAEVTPSSAASPNTIYLNPGTYVLTLGELAFGNSTNLNTQIIGLGSPADTIIKQTTGTNRVFDINFYVLPNVLGAIQNVAISGGMGGAFGGGGILAGGPGNSLLLSNCVISGNRGSNLLNGAGISWGGGGNLTVSSCILSNNVATNAIGGGICFNNGLANPGNLLISNSSILNNAVTAGAGAGLGGGLFIALDNTSTATIRQSVLANNTASANGGAIYTAGGASGSVNVQWCRIVGNSAGAGSGIFNFNSTVSATNNWWGNNAGPGLAVAGSINTSSWLKLGLWATPASLVPHDTAILTAGFSTNSANNQVPAANLSALAGVPVSFNVLSNGTISGAQPVLQASGMATALFTAGNSVGNAAVNATVDAVVAAATISVSCATISANVTGTNWICPGESSTVTVTVSGGVGPYAVTLKDGGISKTNASPITFSVSPSVTSNYQVLSVTDATGCSAAINGSALVTIVPIPSTAISAATNVYLGSAGNQAGGVSGAASYGWSITNGVITSATNLQTITFTAGASGNVGLSLTVGNSLGCGASGFANIPCVVPVPGIPNPSFEANAFSNYPGYCALNGLIAGWTASDTNSIGLNPATSNPFANNGVIPQGANVAFIQAINSTNTLSTEISGLTAGSRYAVGCRINARAGYGTPTLLLGVNGGAPQPFVMPAVAVAGDAVTPYGSATAIFTATNFTAALAVGSCSTDDAALLVDNFTISTLPPALWSVSAWTNDAATGVGITNTLRAYRFGSTTNAVINGVTFLGVAGANPAVVGSFAVSGIPSTYNGTTNTLTSLGGNSSAELGRNFIYGGNPGTLSLYGLAAGQSYRLSLFGIGFDTPGNRNVLFAGGGDLFNVDEDIFGKGSGVRVDYSFVAGATNTTITLTPSYGGNTFHLHGFALTQGSPGPAPAVTIQAPAQSNGALRFSWNAVNLVPYVGYQVQYTTNLSSTNWINQGAVQTGTNTTFSATNGIGPESKRFYRVRLVLQ